MRQVRGRSMLTVMAGLCLLSGCDVVDSEVACLKVLARGDIQRVTKIRDQRFLGKVPEERARCLGGERAVALRQGPWLDWPDIWGDPTNPVLLLTTHELFMDHSVTATWEGMGEPHKSFSGSEHTRTIRNFAEATQRIYLGLPPVYMDREDAYRKRMSKIIKPVP